MIGAEMCAFLRVSKALWNSSVNWKGISLARRLVRGLVIWEKCQFMVCEGIVLGHLVSKRGREVDKVKIEVIEQLPPPINVKGIISFLGHAGFYRTFIANFSQTARLLTSLLAKDTPFQFTDEFHKAFDMLKKALISAPIIQPPRLEVPVRDHV